MTVNKLQLIDVLANKMNISKKEAATAVETIFGTIVDCMKRDEEINVGGFGAFKVKTRAARMGINPKTGEKIQIEQTKAPSFRPSKALKDLFKNS
jgi:DNA-binding protein HU-beta